MNSFEAASLVNGAVFKPGWHLHAVPRDDGRVYVQLAIETVDTSYPGYDGQCRDQIVLDRSRTFDVRDMSGLDLLYAILKHADDIDSHENREFLKVRLNGGRWVAPLHPHTPDGQDAWDRRAAA